ncbi:hypothetical protein O7599_20755 [Streptomyces sp. WMMC500]|uniref:hypothetical protein n=1 Tax=Streptomyces sp. WMMC500 TaxID=3015154 RepID=UPI00248AF126|nr:hypothetical protein [Streptomyces sp. WMMC500]WBB58081.1 hypothetical protein O7599_20755 [Streptomyces sp. WMMC500]
MDTQTLQAQQKLLVRQRARLMVNQYEVFAAAPDGSEGELLAFAQQKRMAFKEQVTLYADTEKQHVFAGFKARKALDVGTTYDVTDAAGAALGTFRKDFKRSLTRSTWHLDQPGTQTATGTERSRNVAWFRRLWNLIPIVNDLPFAIPYHFDFTVAGKPAFSVTKKFSLHDRYVVDIADPALDRRLVVAQAVALDALQSR